MNWNLLLKRLKRGKAILLLGPEVIMSQHPSELPLKEALQAYIKDDLTDTLDKDALQRIEYYSEDGFFFLEDDYRLEVVESILQFYEEQAVHDIYKKIAQLPFSVILSLSPDKLLGQACEAQDLNHHFHFYDKKNYNATLDNSKLDFQPDLDNRLIYNIFGSIDNEDSLILSYDDLFEFLQRIFNNYKLPKTIEEAIFDANCFIFVGFNYSKWYLKLLLRLMKMHEKVRKVFGMDEPLRPDIETFFVNEFDMNFTRLDAVSFVEELYQKCKDEGMLLQAGVAVDTKLPAELHEQLIKYIAEGNLDQFFKVCKQGVGHFESVQHLMPSAFNDPLQLLQARYNKLEKDQRDGVLDNRDYRPALARINRELLELVNEYS